MGISLRRMDNVLLPRSPFLFLRHGQTDWNAQGRIQGHTDMPLNETGLAQARAAAERLVDQSIDAIVSSPLIRARRTAEIVAERLRLPLRLDPELMERSFGRFEGRILAEVKREHGLAPEVPISTIMPPDAEPWPRTRERARGAVAAWLTAEPGETLLFVSHDGLFRALHEQLLGSRPGATHAAPYRFAPAGEGWSITELR